MLLINFKVSLVKSEPHQKLFRVTTLSPLHKSNISAILFRENQIVHLQANRKKRKETTNK